MQDSASTLRFTIVTLDNHLAGAAQRAAAKLRRSRPGLELRYHAASDWASDPESLAACKEDIASSDIILVTMMFIDEHIQAIRPALAARREACKALVVAMSAGEIIKLTKMGGFSMDKPAKGPLALLKRLRGGGKGGAPNSGAKQMAIVKRLPKLLKFIPGKAQDLRAYFLTLQYWLAGSEDNIANLVRFLVAKYAPDTASEADPAAEPPREYPEMGVYHPSLDGGMSADADALPSRPDAVGTVGVILLRSYILSGDAAHYDGVIRALEAQGLRAIPIFASGLDARPAIEAFLMKDGVAQVDALLSLTGFSLVGGPAYNDAGAAEAFLAKLNVPYMSAQAVEFQSLEAWGASGAGLTPVEATIMVAIPELDGAAAPTVYGGRSAGAGEACCGCDKACVFPTSADAPAMRVCEERAEAIAARVARRVALKRTPRGQRKIGIVLFDFPPNAGAVGSAAYLSVFASLHNVLRMLKAAGYNIDAPADVDGLRDAILTGNAAQFGTDGNVHAFIPADDHVRREPHLAEIESQWGAAPGRQLADGRNIFIQGAEFGDVFVGLQPGFGYEGDPMRLLFERGFSATHAFSAFYRYLREDFGAHAVLHFGTHGALEFLPGKQVGLSAACWPERLIGETPNFYLYAANNPSEGAVAKRRSHATLISYLTPPVSQAGLYRGLLDLKDSLDHWRTLPPGDAARRAPLIEAIREQAAALELRAVGAETQEDFDIDPDAAVLALSNALRELEQTLIPEGLHVIGEAPNREERIGYLSAIAEARLEAPAEPAWIEAIVGGATAEHAASLREAAISPEIVSLTEELIRANTRLGEDGELQGVLDALDGGYIRPAPGGDLIRNPEILPTGRNLHGFDPFRLPSAFAVKDGAAQAARLLDRHLADEGALPETIAMVLWGTDNLKAGGGPIAQALSLMGARPRFDGYGRLCGAELTPLEELGRPR
ncbi:MAG: magnesium chelatase subunit H, partial [Pseudomonadota bacterium]